MFNEPGMKELDVLKLSELASCVKGNLALQLVQGLPVQFDAAF